MLSAFLAAKRKLDSVAALTRRRCIFNTLVRCRCRPVAGVSGV
jgi:hypothetical protein